jgi:hypothetical protein
VAVEDRVPIDVLVAEVPEHDWSHVFAVGTGVAASCE